MKVREPTDFYTAPPSISDLETHTDHPPHPTYTPGPAHKVRTQRHRGRLERSMSRSECIAMSVAKPLVVSEVPGRRTRSVRTHRPRGISLVESQRIPASPGVT